MARKNNEMVGLSSYLQDDIHEQVNLHLHHQHQTTLKTVCFIFLPDEVFLLFSADRIIRGSLALINLQLEIEKCAIEIV